MSTSPDCPICRRTTAPEHAPFCSPRCRDRDLLNWLGDAYVVPGAAADMLDSDADERV